MKSISQVRRFAERCFVRKAKLLKFVRNCPENENDVIGVLKPVGPDRNFTIHIGEKRVSIQSSTFTGEIQYQNISRCEVVGIGLDKGALSHFEVIDIEYLKTLDEHELERHYKSINGVTIISAGSLKRILLDTGNYDETIELVYQFCDFIRRVRVTQAWR